ncbi:MAG: hypothetical protein ACLP50_15405 [Solirubrobacteraceae bacterium]
MPASMQACQEPGYDRSMQWSQAFMSEVGEAIVRLGLSACRICESQQVAISKYPFPMYRGGNQELKDKDTNVEFFVKLECVICGNAMFVNSERYRTGDEPIFAGPLP